MPIMQWVFTKVRSLVLCCIGSWGQSASNNSIKISARLVSPCNDAPLQSAVCHSLKLAQMDCGSAGVNKINLQKRPDT